MNPDLSVVIPVFNEASSLHELHGELASALRTFKGDYEVIYVDDGSSDDSWRIIKEIASSDRRVEGLRLRRNFGQSTALTAGFDHCSATVVATMDADLQNNPQDILGLLEKLKEGYDLVCGWRQDRQDPFLEKRLPSTLSNRMARRLSGIQIHDFGCTLRAYTLPVVREVSLYGELHRFLPALAAWRGFTVAEIPVGHRARRHGTSKYGTGRILRGTLDLISVFLMERYMSRPVHLFGTIGALLILVGLTLGGYLGVERIFFNVPLADRPIILLPVISLLVGLQLFMLGVLAEMLNRVRYEEGGFRQHVTVFRRDIEKSE